MSDDKKMIESTWAEARDLVRQLEGTTVQRFAVKAGEYEIEIERGAPAQAAPSDGAPAMELSGPLAHGAAAGPGVAAGARAASGVFTLGDAAQEADNRVPVLAPLVGTFYRASQPGAKPFVEEGDVVEMGQTVCIVEAMKLMNEIGAGEAGKVVEICVEVGEPVEFEQVLMYLEPSGE
ncbi:MAG: acetyl-CoA carboxylase biotin carboxyl carrier protein [Thermoleophilaceae bacterium]